MWLEKLLILGRSGTQYVAMVTKLLRSYCGANVVESYCKESSKVNRTTLSLLISFLWRYQDKNTAAMILLRASTQWLTLRGDLLSNFLVTSVTAGALLATQSPGKLII